MDGTEKGRRTMLNQITPTRHRNMLINPLRISPGLGAAYAVQGFKKSVPFFHSAPGCSFLGKVLLTQHFMEPVAAMGSDIKETALVFGGTSELENAVKKFCEKNSPDILYVLSTSVPEIRGEIYDSFSEFCANTGLKHVILQVPDFKGGFSEGFSLAVCETLRRFAKGGSTIEKQVNVIPAPYMTAADIDEIAALISDFGFLPLVIPDISSGIDGSKENFISMSPAGTSYDQIVLAGRSEFTFSFGNSMKPAGDFLEGEFGVRHHFIDSIYGLTKTDNFIATLMEASSGTEVAHRISKERARLRDIMIDTHLHLNNKNAALAMEYDQALAMRYFLDEIGVTSAAAISPFVPAEETGITQGTLYDLEEFLVSGGEIDIIYANTHGREVASNFGIPMVHAGFPVSDVFGYNYRLNVGYKGGISMISTLANLILEKK